MHQENQITIRIAETRDMSELAELRWKLCTDDIPELPSPEKKLFIDEFCSQLQVRDHGEVIHFLAEKGNVIVALMSVIKVQGLPHPDKSKSSAWGYLTNVYTLPEFRNKGIGSDLLDEVRYWAQKQNLELLIVWPSEKSYPFYERSGFLRERDPLVLKIATEN